MIELTGDYNKLCFNLGEHDKNINKTNKIINKPNQVVRTVRKFSVRLYENFR